MKTNQHNELDSPPAGVAQHALDALDPDSPEFIAACLAVINQTSPQGSHGETDESVDAPDGTADPQESREAAPSQPSEVSGGSQPTIVETSGAVLEHKEPRRSVARSRAKRSPATSPESVPADADTRPEVKSRRRALKVDAADRDASTPDLKKATRQEAQVRAELQNLQADLKDVESQHDQATDALKAAVQSHSQMRAELAAVTAQRDASASDLENATRQEAQVRAELQHLHADLKDVKSQHDETTRAFKAAVQSDSRVRAELASVTLERDTARSDLKKKKATRQETQLRTEVRALQAELESVRSQYADNTKALQEAGERDSEVRAELRSAKETISNHDSANGQLRQVITDRDREISDLQLKLLQAEEARAADAAAILTSLDKLRA